MDVTAVVVTESSRTDPDDDVFDVASFSALDVVEKKNVVVTVVSHRNSDVTDVLSCALAL